MFFNFRQVYKKYFKHYQKSENGKQILKLLIALKYIKY